MPISPRIIASVSALILALCLSSGHAVERVATSFNEAQGLYEAGEYEQARGLLQNLVDQHPDDPRYQHWLGKACGRIAETANWLKAMKMAKKTRQAFEKAVELDGSYLEAMEDLRQYYLDAPGFLGGSKQKAEALEARILVLQDSRVE